jgi:hypothetical protein
MPVELTFVAEVADPPPGTGEGRQMSIRVPNRCVGVLSMKDRYVRESGGT